MPHKIGVLTFHRCINYGSYWQARCLVEGLRGRGHEVVLLDHNSRRVNLAEWKCAFRPALPAAVPAADLPLYRRKIQKFFDAFASLPLSRRFSLEGSSDMERFDVVVVGSDEVWNLSHPWYGGCALFFGDGVRTRRLISYAASFGCHPAAEGLEPWWTERLRRFDAISVRDDTSRGVIANALGVAPELALDPCLQFACTAPGSGGTEDAAEGLEADLARPFVAVYGHTFSRSFSLQVRRWARSHGCRLVSIGYRNDWADEQWIAAGPYEFARALARADALATNFFHGCVFALRNATPFVCEMSPYRTSKIRDLLTMLGARRHLVSARSAPATYDRSLSEPVAQAVLQRIAGFRRSANAYLNASLA